MDDFADVSIMRSDAELIQIMDRRASQGSALKLVANHYGVPMSEVMAVGDEVNDVSMLKPAGAAVAMDNAPQRRVHAVVVVARGDPVGDALHGRMRRGLCD